jgi:aspartate 1-decarboxylase
MLRRVLKSEIHGATVMESLIERREGVEIPSDLVERVGLCDGERILVASVSSGVRLETHVNAVEALTGRIAVCGSVARGIKAGERVTIMAFGYSHEPVLPQKVVLNERNEEAR